MSKFEIVGGNRLCGSVRIGGAKNSVLPLLACSVMTDEVTVIEDCPHISDVEDMLKLLRLLGAEARWSGNDVITKGCLSEKTVGAEYASSMRSSIFLLGTLLSVCGEAKLARPGGCDIGERPIDLHIKGLNALGFEARTEGDYVVARSVNPLPSDIFLTYPSVGATENLILASVFISGKTRIFGAAMEPEIVDLANMLNAMGACVDGAGSSIVTVRGVCSLHGCSYRPFGDRIIAGTLALACAICGGEVELQNACLPHISALLPKIDNSACNIIKYYDNIIISCDKKCVSPREVVTSPYPYFPTDLQAPMMALACCSIGDCLFRETVFERRFSHVDGLRAMGANIQAAEGGMRVSGVEKLHGAQVAATDLRGGAALAIAALGADGKTVLDGVSFIDRGYPSFETTLCNLGANVKRIR